VANRIRSRQIRWITEEFHHRIAYIVRRHEFGAGSFPDVDRIADMIGMSMRDQDQIHALERCDFLLAAVINGICDPGIDKKNTAARRNDFKGRLAIPSQVGCHADDETEKISPSKSNDECGSTNIQARGSAEILKHEAVRRVWSILII
jgi:hypothetical protein